MLNDHAGRSLSVARCQCDAQHDRRVPSLLTGCLLLLGLIAGPALGSDPPAVDHTAPPDTALTVGEVRLDLRDIFTPEEVRTATGPNRTLRRAMNALHVNTRPWVVRRELLFAPGDPLDEDRLRESARNLRALGILNRVEIAPVDTTDDGQVDILVRAQETWTLSFGLNFALVSSGALRWNLAMTEKNFLGLGTTLQAVVGDDLDARYGRLYLRQNRLLRTGLSLELNYDERSDGHTRWFGLSLPFRSDDQTWSFVTRALERRHSTRWYLSNAGPAGSDPARGERLYLLLPRDAWTVRAEVLRRVSPAGRGRVWRLGAGVMLTDLDHDLREGLFTLSDGRRLDVSFLEDPGQPLMRDRGTEVWPHLILANQGRRWITTRYVLRYGIQEDVPLDPAWVLRAGPAGPAVGSTTTPGDRWRVDLGLSNWLQVGRGFWLQRLSGLAYLGAAGDRQHQIEALVGNIQRLGPPERPYTLKTFLEAGHGDGLRGELAWQLGLDRGLRTLDLDGMAGDRLLRWTVELGRTWPVVVADIVQLGWGVFYSGGLARWADEDRDLGDASHEIGAGLRFGSTRSGTSDVARLDFTYDLSGRTGVVVTTVARGFF